MCECERERDKRVGMCQWRPEDGVVSFGAGVTGICDMHDVCDGI